MVKELSTYMLFILHVITYIYVLMYILYDNLYI